MMRPNKYPLFLFLPLLLLLSCQGKSLAPLPGDPSPVQTLSVHPSDERFDNLIYRLEAGQVTPCYRVELPEPLPLSLVEEKTNPADLIRSKYSWGISDVFVCEDLLYCWFTKAGSFQMVFYDLKANKEIYCGRIPWNRPTPKLPLFFPIGGVYRNTFFSVAEPEFIRDKMEKSPELFSAEMKEITEFSNPVILFYKRHAIGDK